ncbi:hypothetical protein [Martelella sp. FOR1707]
MTARKRQPSFAIFDSQAVKSGPDAGRDIVFDADKNIGVVCLLLRLKTSNQQEFLDEYCQRGDGGSRAD